MLIMDLAHLPIVVNNVTVTCIYCVSSTTSASQTT